MSMQIHQSNNNRKPKIQRSHSGCRPCRKRGKLCDETKPFCRACERLSLDCSYGVEFTFRNSSGAPFKRNSVSQSRSSQSSVSPKPLTLRNAPGKGSATCVPGPLSQPFDTKLPVPLSYGDNLEAGYLSHFQRHVRHLLPAVSLRFTDDNSLQHPCLRFSVLCISASNLSMLNSRIQSRVVVNNHRICVFSPLANHLHHWHAQKYHNQALGCLSLAGADEVKHHAPEILVAHVLMAYYHHASTNHLRFRLAVMDSVRFVLLNRANIMDSPDGADSLQMWYRLCTSHRPAKPPALLLDGEGASSFGPNFSPGVPEHLHLSCILGMTVDDLIYDILIKTMEIRARLVVFRCVASSYNVSELSTEIGILAHEVSNRMLGRHCVPDEYAEAQAGFVRGPHLLGLLGVQKERLKVWKSRLNADQLSTTHFSNSSLQTTQQVSSSTVCQKSSIHRRTMNTLYCRLCEMIFEETGGSGTNKIGDLAHNICQIAGTLDFTASNISDVYTFSLAETLLQLVFLWQSDDIFHYILDILWPQLEIKGRGYEHSHYPTHLVKRIITRIAIDWAQNRTIHLALPAVPENISKLQLLDVNHPVDLVIYGSHKCGKHFIEKTPLP